MDLTDATLAVLLAARIHGMDEAVRRTAERCVKLLPNHQRSLMLQIVASRKPLELIAHLAETDLDCGR